MEKKTLTLETPIEFNEERITVLEFKGLKARHLRNIPGKPGFGDLLDLVSKSTGLPVAAINELSAEDAVKAVEAVSVFFGSGQATGEDM